MQTQMLTHSRTETWNHLARALTTEQRGQLRIYFMSVHEQLALCEFRILQKEMANYQHDSGNLKCS